MVRTINKRFSNITGEEEKPWFCEKIKREISIRNNLLKKKLTNMKEKLLMTLEKRKDKKNYGTLSTH